MQTSTKVVGKKQKAPELSEENQHSPLYFIKSYRHRLRPTPHEYEDIRNLCPKVIGNTPLAMSTFFAIRNNPAALAAFLLQCFQVKLEALPSGKI